MAKSKYGRHAKKAFAKALGVPVKWTNFTNGGAMTDAMLAGDIDISYSQGLVPFINAVKSKAPIKLVDIAMEYGMGAVSYTHLTLPTKA